MTHQGKNKNINTVDYWDTRFGTGDWARKGGYSQTSLFAEDQLPYLRIPSSFKGSICDFGCGAGDAFPVYHRAWPNAKLLGVDFSVEAIQLCTKRYGHLAEFVCGGISAVPKADVIICSNVLEHLDDDAVVVEQLLSQCATLFIIVPYKECPLSYEHVRIYNKDSFACFNPQRKLSFNARGWGVHGWQLYRDIYLKNIVRFISGQALAHRQKQIMFEIIGKHNAK